MSYSWLPPTLNEIADVAGLDAALAMAQARGGSRVSLPAKPKQNSWLVDAVGFDAAEKICAHYRTGYGGTKGVTLDLPVSPDMNLLKRRRKIDELLQNGLSADQIAIRTGAHRTTVFYRKRHAKPTPKLPDLFD